METATKKATKEQIEEWKAEHGGVFKVTAEDGTFAYLRDPVHDFMVMKLCFETLSKSELLFAKAVLDNCFLAGNDAFLTDESYANGLVDQLKEFVSLPDCEVKREGNGFVLEADGKTLKCRMAKRADILIAEQKNPAREPFKTAAELLKIVCLDKEALQDISQHHTKAYLGFLAGVEQIKDKRRLAVEKL